MGQDKISQLKNKILKKDSIKKSDLTDIVALAKELSCLPEVLGRDYEVVSPEGKLIFTIRQKPITLKQLNTLLKEVDLLHKIEEENSKKGSKGKTLGRLGKRKR